MTLSEREDMLNTLRYFWTEKQDLERWIRFDRATLQREFPDVLKAWDDYQTAKRVMGSVMRGTV